MGCDTAAPTATVAPVPAATATSDVGGSAPTIATTDATATTRIIDGDPSPTSADSAAAPTATTSSTSQAAACIKLDLNSATEAQLMTIPNFSSRWVREFMEYRPYVSIQQFRKELGKYVDQTQVAEWEKYVY